VLYAILYCTWFIFSISNISFGLLGTPLGIQVSAPDENENEDEWGDTSQQQLLIR
jgi:hypothetical protein